MISPIKNYIIGMKFGAPVWYPPFWHPGLDLFPVPGMSRELIAPFNGVVAYSGYSIVAGWIVDINLDNGLAVRFCHMTDRAMVAVGQQVSQGQDIGQMGGTGTEVWPLGTVHLHYVVFQDHSRTNVIDPLPYLTSNTDTSVIDIPSLFTLIWHRLPAKGEILYFQSRLDKKTITDRNDMITKMTYWYQQVYPKGVYNKTGDDAWQRSKTTELG